MKNEDVIQFERCEGRDIRLGELAVLRALPARGRRLIGPWCFLDRFGPLSFTEGTLEYAVLVLTGECRLDGQPLRDRVLYYLGMQRSDAAFASESGARVLLVGGPPFPEAILMWWNFVARTAEEISEGVEADREERSKGI